MFGLDDTKIYPLKISAKNIREEKGKQVIDLLLINATQMTPSRPEQLCGSGLKDPEERR